MAIGGIVGQHSPKEFPDILQKFGKNLGESFPTGEWGRFVFPLWKEDLCHLFVIPIYREREKWLSHISAVGLQPAAYFLGQSRISWLSVCGAVVHKVGQFICFG